MNKQWAIVINELKLDYFDISEGFLSPSFSGFFLIVLHDVLFALFGIGCWSSAGIIVLLI